MSAVKSVTDQSLIRIRARAGIRLGMLSVGHPFSRCLVNEFPKSGGSWLAKMLGGGLELDFPQNVLPTKFPAIFHGHYMRDFSRVPKIVLWRDPRDIMVSWYYHCLFGNERNNLERVSKNRERLGFADFDDARENMPRFIDWCFGPDGEPSVTWAQFFDKWFDFKDNTFHTSYERLRENTVGEMGEILKWLGAEPSIGDIEALVEEHSFGRQASRKAGDAQSSSFLRKGIVGDWKNVFDAVAEERLKEHLSSRLDRIETFIR